MCPNFRRREMIFVGKRPLDDHLRGLIVRAGVELWIIISVDVCRFYSQRNVFLGHGAQFLCLNFTRSERILVDKELLNDHLRE